MTNDNTHTVASPPVTSSTSPTVVQLPINNNSNSSNNCYGMMSSIKMDELLVTHWLGSDTVYTNVLEWIDEHSIHNTNNNHTNIAAATATITTMDGTLDHPISNKENEGVENVTNIYSSLSPESFSTTATTTTTVAAAAAAAAAESIIIPPFYPVGQQKKVQRILRNNNTNNNHNSALTSQSNNSNHAIATAATTTTTANPTVDLTTSNEYNDTHPIDPSTNNTLTNNNNNPFYNHFSSWDSPPSSRQDDDEKEANNENENAVLYHQQSQMCPKCVRDVVQIIYDDYSNTTTATNHPENMNHENDNVDDDDDDDDMDDIDGMMKPTQTTRSATNKATTTISIQSNTVLSIDHFHRITKDICHFPSYFNTPFYQRIIDVWNDQFHSNATATVVTVEMLEYYWKLYMEPYDDVDRFFQVIKPMNNNRTTAAAGTTGSSSSSSSDMDYIVRDDFLPYVQALLREHPGLEFLSSHGEFQEKYAVTVITRIFYCVNTDHSGKITSRQIRHSDLYGAFQLVDNEDDINKVTRYFSYEHFYVLYCRFWELDHDRDYKITREDLLKYGDHSLSHMIVDRIFDAAPRPFIQSQVQQMNNNNNNNVENDITTPATAITTNKINRDYLSYEDFIYFMLSEEDKSNEIAVRYWFQCVDVDGDGQLNNMEMRSFYAVQLHRMSCMGHETVPFEDMLCQMMDMMKPANTDHLIVADFLQKECRTVSGALFDALFSLNKYMLFEQRDPFNERQKREDEFATDWDRFACMDYNRLAMEEEAREEEAMEIDWVTVDDDDDDDDDNNNNSNTNQHDNNNNLVGEGVGANNNNNAGSSGTSTTGSSNYNVDSSMMNS